MSTAEIIVTNPYTGAEAFRIPALSAGEIDAVVSRARAAFSAWRHTAVADRVALCQGMIDWFEANADAVARDITVQMGKPLGQARGEVNGTIERARHMMSIAEETLADDLLPEKEGFQRYIRHEPLGVVLDIAAWNYPLLIAVNVVVPGILAGNAVIIKHSSKTPKCGEAFAEAFRTAGAPEGLVQAVAADHAVTERLIQHPGVDHVSFTGSVSGGREVNRSAADRFIGVGLELGGKDPAYVCADANFDWAVANCVDGAFYNAGQSCCAIERIYVEAPVYDRFVESYAAAVRAYVVGDPMAEGTTIGPLASKGAPAFLTQQVTEAVAAGGRLVVDPAEFRLPETGYFAAPAVVADAPQDSGLMQEESFGPVIGILKVSGDEEAIRHMNDSAYGLTASIWTADVARAIRIGEQIETGTFYMNRCDYLDPALPWCGVKDTGRGATLSKYGLLGLTRLKSMHLRTTIPS
ncbi:MAG: aldehyde dehydrogenase family protein [Candidatus Hydrogenedentes bacterium]|nr:aldehyde dehydrogenase family protein [Candidatus Hydrogenedentota bacterium]